VLQQMDAVVHYRHAPEEVVELELAAIPLMESIKRVSTGWQRTAMKRILGCEFFRAREATNMRNMMIRAVTHSRPTLDEFFPTMRQDTLIQAQALEDAIKAYWVSFQRLREETLPTH